ncbi:MAG: peptidase M13 [Proteobacteria bacterium]|nr:peptidase M13 [Pseudomonadota bacterium]
MFAAAASALLAGLPAAAEVAHPERDCLDVSCSTVALFAQGGSAGGAALAASTAAPRFGTWGFDLAGMDRTVKPGQDFYTFANGTWDKNTPIPADRSSYGNFAALREISDARTRAILDEAVAGQVQDVDAGRIAAFYRSYMDEPRVEQLDAKPLQADLAAIRAADTKAEIARLWGASNTGFGGSWFGTSISDDAKAPGRYTVYVGQSGLGMPDRDYYLDPKFAKQKAAYQDYVATVLGYAGWADPQEAAKAVVAWETRIAQVHWTRAASRDRDKTYNPMTRAELARYAPGFPWQEYLRAAQLNGVNKIVLRQNTAIPALTTIFSEAPVEVLQTWSVFHLVNGASPYLSKRFADANFEFYGKTLSGQPEQRERWKRAVSFTDGQIGESVGRVYVARHFTPEAKAKMDDLVANLRTALQARLQQLNWMGPETKAKALDKLAKFDVKIGYPSKWRDYSGLQADPTDLYGNAERGAAFEWTYDVGRLNKPVDETEWGMTPQTVNAYYSSVKNEIVFPAAILQPPFFDPDADPAVNYGGIGGVIGHEIIHGFDDQGRKSNGDGLLTEWWTEEDERKFEAQAAKLGAQYEGYDVIDGRRINGRLSMGENIADLGGLTVALDAYQRSLDGKPAPVLDGMTGDQRFFLGWAQVWRTKFRDEALRQQLVTGPHSPGMFRAKTPVRNIDAWYDAFQVQPGDPLYIAPADRVRLW